MQPGGNPTDVTIAVGASALSPIIYGITHEIGRRAAIANGRPEDWLNERFITRIVQLAASDVILDWFLGEFDPVAVHVLHHGLPLCRFTAKVPAEWPERHKWVGMNESDDANCPICQRIIFEGEYDGKRSIDPEDHGPLPDES